MKYGKKILAYTEVELNYDNISATFYQKGEDVVIHGLTEAWDDLGDKMLEILIEEL